MLKHFRHGRVHFDQTAFSTFLVDVRKAEAANELI